MAFESLSGKHLPSGFPGLFQAPPALYSATCVERQLFVRSPPGAHSAQRPACCANGAGGSSTTALTAREGRHSLLPSGQDGKTHVWVCCAYVYRAKLEGKQTELPLSRHVTAPVYSPMNDCYAHVPPEFCLQLVLVLSVSFAGITRNCAMSNCPPHTSFCLKLHLCPSPGT